MSGDLIAVGTGIVILAAVLLGIVLLVMQFYVKVEQGQAMIVNTMRQTPDVTFTGRLVIPVIHKKEMMNISLKTIEINRAGSDGLICNDNIRADIKVAFFVRVNKTQDDVLKVAQAIGCERASEQSTVEELFSAKFSEALKTVGKQLDFVDLYQERNRFRDDIIRVIGSDLNGYVLEDAAIDYLEQTPLSQLDSDNILDAEGIRKITELTAKQHILTNELQRDEQTKIKKKDVEAREKILELERMQADAEARQAREIATVQSREQAETDKIAAEEKLKAETARISSDQEIAIQEENKNREVEVAVKNKERALAIETEKVERVRQMEVIGREREVSLGVIEKDKAVEIEKKAIADVVRERIAVDKTVAEEEERIKELRIVSEAERNKKADIIMAEAVAEQDLVKEIKAAEASEQTSVFRAKEQLTLAEARREAAAKEAEAKKRLAEGIKEEEAATGLAEAMVLEAKAVATEKQGLAEARVKQEKMHAEAIGKEEIGMADVRIKEADANSEEQQAMVDIKVQVAEAEAIREKGEAEAGVILQRLKAEAEGLAEKFNAMSSMNDNVRSHEEFRMELDNAHNENMEAISANTHIAEKQAKVLAQALEKANIDIVGGDGKFLDSFIKSLSVGKAVDGAISKSETLQSTLTRLIALGSGDQKFSVPELIETIKGLSRKQKA